MVPKQYSPIFICIAVLLGAAAVGLCNPVVELYSKKGSGKHTIEVSDIGVDRQKIVLSCYGQADGGTLGAEKHRTEKRVVIELKSGTVVLIFKDDAVVVEQNGTARGRLGHALDNAPGVYRRRRVQELQAASP